MCSFEWLVVSFCVQVWVLLIWVLECVWFWLIFGALFGFGLVWCFKLVLRCCVVYIAFLAWVLCGLYNIVSVTGVFVLVGLWLPLAVFGLTSMWVVNLVLLIWVFGWYYMFWWVYYVFPGFKLSAWGWYNIASAVGVGFLVEYGFWWYC